MWIVVKGLTLTTHTTKPYYNANYTTEQEIQQTEAGINCDSNALTHNTNVGWMQWGGHNVLKEQPVYVGANSNGQHMERATIPDLRQLVLKE